MTRTIVLLLALPVALCGVSAWLVWRELREGLDGEAWVRTLRQDGWL